MTAMHLQLPELPGAGRLGRHIEHDERSRAFGVERGWDWLVQLRAPRTVLHERRIPILDQGDVGSCTGNAMCGWLGTEPYASWHAGHSTPGPTDLDEALALELYEVATTLDAFPGQYPPDDTGSSGLAVAKAAVKLGYIRRYRHAFTVHGLLHALQAAPVIVGIPWYAGFDTPASDGLVTISGGVRGGHEVLIRGFDAEAGLLTLDNSWGPGYGVAGSFRMSVDTFAQLRWQGADVTVPEVPA